MFSFSRHTYSIYWGPNSLRTETSTRSSTFARPNLIFFRPPHCIGCQKLYCFQPFTFLSGWSPFMLLDWLNRSEKRKGERRRSRRSSVIRCAGRNSLWCSASAKSTLLFYITFCRWQLLFLWQLWLCASNCSCRHICVSSQVFWRLER